MSYNTVNALMKGIADAIRAKDGTSAAIAHQDFPDRIAAIQSGIDLKDVLEKRYSSHQIEMTGPWTQEEVYIFDGMFDECSDLQYFSIDGVPVRVGNYAFNQCQNLQYLYIDPIEIRENGFYFTGLSGDLYFPNLEYVGKYAFGACSGITSFSATSLEEVGECAFAMCDGLTSVDIPNCIEIGSRGFAQTGIEEAEFPSLKYIHSEAFFSSSLKKIILSNNAVCTLDNTNAFMNTDIMRGRGEIRVPASLVNEYKTSTNWSYFASSILAIPEG